MNLLDAVLVPINPQSVGDPGEFRSSGRVVDGRFGDALQQAETELSSESDALPYVEVPSNGRLVAIPSALPLLPAGNEASTSMVTAEQVLVGDLGPVVLDGPEPIVQDFESGATPLAEVGRTPSVQVDRISWEQADTIPSDKVNGLVWGEAMVDTSDVENVARYLLRESQRLNAPVAETSRPPWLMERAARSVRSSSPDGSGDSSSFTSPETSGPLDPAIGLETSPEGGARAAAQDGVSRLAAPPKPVWGSSEATPRHPNRPERADHVESAVQAMDLEDADHHPVRAPRAASQEAERSPTTVVEPLPPESGDPGLDAQSFDSQLADVDADAAPVRSARAEAQRLLTEATRRFNAERENRVWGRRLNLDIGGDDGGVRLTIEPTAEGQHRIAFLVAQGSLREELRRWLPEIRDAVTHFPVEVAEVSIEVMPPPYEEPVTATRQGSTDRQVSRRGQPS